MGRGRPRNYAQKKLLLRQAPPLNHHHQYLHHYLHYPHQHFHPQRSHCHLLPNKWPPFHPSKNFSLKSITAPIKIPLPRSQSAERAQPSGLARTPSLPSLSPTDFSSQELFPAMISPKRNPPEKKKQELTIGQMQRAAALCSAELEAVGGLPAPEGTKAVGQAGNNQ